MNVDAVGLLSKAYAAVESGNFAGAVECTLASLALADLAEAHDLYAGLMLADDQLDKSRSHWETAFRFYRESGQDRAAIKVGANIAMLYSDDSNLAAARGWILRSRRLADSVGRCVERGYVELALMACDVSDVFHLEEAAKTALELAIEFGDVNLEARALADLGVALISQGRIADGLARVDEAMAPVSAGELTDPGQAGSIFCAMLTACERTGDVRRAEEWLIACQAYTGTHLFGKFPVLQAHCRIAYGRVLFDAGRLSEVEPEIEALQGAAATAFISKRASAAGVLADLRMTQGRFEEARDLLAPFADRSEICTELARLHLLTGDSELAIAAATRGLERIEGDRLQAGRLLSLLVEAHVARGNLDAARSCAKQIATLSEGSDSTVLSAQSEYALGQCLLREGDAASAAASFKQALALLSSHERPFMEARTLLAHATALAALDDSAGAINEARAAMTAFERLGAKRDADEAAALLRSLGAAGRMQSRASRDTLASLTGREREVLSLLKEGLTNAAIAERLFISPKTTEHHVGRILSKLGLTRRSEVPAALSRQGVISGLQE